MKYFCLLRDDNVSLYDVYLCLSRGDSEGTRQENFASVFKLLHCCEIYRRYVTHFLSNIIKESLY